MPPAVCDKVSRLAPGVPRSIRGVGPDPSLHGAIHLAVRSLDQTGEHGSEFFRTESPDAHPDERLRGVPPRLLTQHEFVLPPSPFVTAFLQFSLLLADALVLGEVLRGLRTVTFELGEEPRVLHDLGFEPRKDHSQVASPALFLLRGSVEPRFESADQSCQFSLGPVVSFRPLPFRHSSLLT